MVERRGQPKVSEFVEISISHKVIEYCNRYNESPFKDAAREKQRIDKLEEERIERNRAAALKERSLIYWTNPHDQGNYRSIHSEEYQSRYKKKKYEYY
ncbi:hypothetical protein PQZ44_03070 [Candidatus Pelagibacter ubique]|nr:hypothetical protein [Candidatus Pelagibacter ubique]